MKAVQYILILSVFIFLSCGGDGDEASCNNKDAVVTATIDGNVVNFTTINQATIFKGVDPVTGTGLEGYRLDMILTADDGASLIITVNQLGGGSGECMDVGKVWTAETNQELAVFTLTTASGQTFISFGSDYIGSFNFTACDESNQSISGEFDIDFEIVTLTKGSFSNVCYTALN